MHTSFTELLRGKQRGERQKPSDTTYALSNGALTQDIVIPENLTPNQKEEASNDEDFNDVYDHEVCFLGRPWPTVV